MPADAVTYLNGCKMRVQMRTSVHECMTGLLHKLLLLNYRTEFYDTTYGCG